MPTAIVHTHTVTPVGASAVGRRQPRDSSQPTPVPTRKGQAVSASPARVSPSVWLRRPTAVKPMTQTMSVARAANEDQRSVVFGFVATVVHY